MSAEPVRGAVAAIALPRWQRLAIYATVAAVVVSGVAWLAVTWPPGSQADALDAGQRSAAAWALRVHGIAAYVALIVVGSVLPVHLRLAWARRRNRGSGGVLAGLLLSLAATGLWLYYGGEGGRSLVSLWHWLLGLVLPAWLLVHRARGLRSRRIPPPA